MGHVLFIAIAYVVGSIPVGVLLAGLKGKDPRRTGSGNIGATNVMRAAGRTLGVLTLAGDICKGLIPTLIAMISGEPETYIALVGLAAFAGHLFPVFLRFKGGKGVATALGVYLAINPLAILISIIVFVIVFLAWKYVSLGSLIGTGVMPFTLLLLSAPDQYILLSVAIGILVFVKHKDNIKRLLQGKENAVELGKGCKP